MKKLWLMFVVTLGILISTSGFAVDSTEPADAGDSKSKLTTDKDTAAGHDSAKVDDDDDKDDDDKDQKRRKLTRTERKLLQEAIEVCGPREANKVLDEVTK